MLEIHVRFKRRWPRTREPAALRSVANDLKAEVVRSSNLLEIAVPSEPIPETSCARHTVRDQCLAPVVPFLNQRLAHAKTVTFDGGASIGAYADERPLWG
jgi:hypothetical protein